MFGKMTPGNSFGTCFNYVTRKKLDDEPGEDKGWNILDSDGVRLSVGEDNWRKIAADDIERPTLTRAKIKDPCGHISLSFSPEDTDRLTDDFMLKIAHEYMNKMGFKNTPYIIVRHRDKDHPHCHLMFSRVDYDGKIIKSACNFRKNKAVCLDITERHNLTMGKDSLNLDTQKLRGSEKSRIEIRQIANEVLKDKSITDWPTFQKRLSQRGVNASALFSEEPERKLKTIIYKKGTHSFVASKIGKQYTPWALVREFDKRKNQALATTPDPSNPWINRDGSPIVPDNYDGIRLTPEQQNDYLKGRTIHVGDVYIRIDFDKKEPQVSRLNPDMMEENGRGLPFHPNADPDYVSLFSGLGRWDKEEFKRFRRRHPSLTNQEAIRMFRTDHNLSRGFGQHM